MGYWTNGLIRLKSFSAVLPRWWADWRRIPYDLMPLVASCKGRNYVAKVMAIGAPQSAPFAPSTLAKKLYQDLSQIVY